MKTIFMALSACITSSLFAQDLTKQAQPVVEEGKMLYRLEMASWYGTDLFLENYKQQENIKGYFSYFDGDKTKCIFFSNDPDPEVIGTVSFDKDYHVKNANVNLDRRLFTSFEREVFRLRNAAFELVEQDSFFKHYNNTSFNLIPIIEDSVRKVYVLTGTAASGIVIFGNDYLLTFDKGNNPVSKKRLHQNLITVRTDQPDKSDEVVEGAMHSHMAETGDFITATDICTLMLYSKFTSWKTHIVISEHYMNIWDCKKNKLTVVPNEVMRKIETESEFTKKKQKRG